MMERKCFEIKAADAKLDGNVLKGAAAVMGNLDRGDDVIFPGAFDGVLTDFLKDGFVAVGHAWCELPIAMPTLAEVRGRQLYTEATFHSTQDAQDARTVASERIKAGMGVGLSIGFDMESAGYKYFESGEELIAFARDIMRLDMSLFDVPGIQAAKDYCRAIFKVDNLYEYSIVSVPMNPLAQATDAKSAARDARTERDFERFLRDVGGLSKTQAVAVTLHGFKGLASLRDADDEKPVPGGAKTASDSPTATETLRHRTATQRIQSRLRTLGVPLK